MLMSYLETERFRFLKKICIFRHSVERPPYMAVLGIRIPLNHIKWNNLIMGHLQSFRIRLYLCSLCSYLTKINRKENIVQSKKFCFGLEKFMQSEETISKLSDLYWKPELKKTLFTWSTLQKQEIGFSPF